MNTENEKEKRGLLKTIAGRFRPKPTEKNHAEAERSELDHLSEKAAPQDLPPDLLGGVFLSSRDRPGCPPEENQLYQLFRIRMESDFCDSICLDIRNGDPYFVHDELRNIGAAYGSEQFLTKIRYNNVREYHPGADYADLNENTWQRYIPNGKYESACAFSERNRVTIPPGEQKRGKESLRRFYLEKHNYHYHTITYLRKTDSGFRIFFIRAIGWTCGLGFAFDRSEKMIRELLTTDKFGYGYAAFDRLLSAEEADYLQSEAAQANRAEPGETDLIVVKCFQIWDRSRTKSYTKAWGAFSGMCERLAEYGSDASLATDARTK